MDTKVQPEVVPFLKAKEMRKRLEEVREHNIFGDALLLHILRSLAVGKADDPKAVALVALELVQERWHVRPNKKDKKPHAPTIL